MLKYGFCVLKCGFEIPIKFWTVKVERQHRIRLPPAVVENVPWLANAKASVEVLSAPTESSGYRIFAPASPEEIKIKKWEKDLEKRAATKGFDELSLIKAARYLATVRRLTFSLEETRFTLSLPKDLRDAGFLPAAGGHIVVFTFKSVMELWPSGDWRKEGHELAGTSEDLLDVD